MPPAPSSLGERESRIAFLGIAIAFLGTAVAAAAAATAVAVGTAVVGTGVGTAVGTAVGAELVAITPSSDAILKRSTIMTAIRHGQGVVLLLLEAFLHAFLHAFLRHILAKGLLS